MTYKNKTITKHVRGNWFARVRHNGKVFSIYGRTQSEAYEKLKAFVDKTESVRAVSGERFLQKLDALTTQSAIQPLIQPQVPAASKNARTYTLKEWFDEWLQSYKVGHVRAVTIYGFKKDFKYLHKLYDVNICETTNLMLSKTISDVVSTRMKDKVHNLIKQMFSTAFNNRLIESNPAASLPRPKQFAIKQQRAFTQEQEKQFIDLCLADLDRYEPFLICLLQGLRKGEMLALRPDDFDFTNNALRIDESYDRKFPDDLQTKNQAGNRTMPMFNLTRQILLKYADCNPKERVYAKNGTDNSLKQLGESLERSGLPKLTLHELRHTFISRCHEKRIDEIIVQKWVGHTIGSRMTKAVYTHVSDDTERRYIEILNSNNH